jgi:inosine-uridine nucleoside N-ribohydrolase
VTARPRVVLDCDPGHDDVMAIFTAARHADLAAITTVAGNAPLVHTTRNALVTTELIGLDVPVVSGAAGPLVGEARHAAAVHGETGLAGVDVPEPRRAADGDDAAGFLIDLASTHDDLWIVAVGPLTNVASALQSDATLATRVAGISVMGGGTFGNVTAVAEFNVWADPEAAAVVFSSAARIVMCGLDLTHQVCVDDDFVARLRAFGTPAGDFTSRMLGHYRDTIRKLAHRDLAALHDPCAVLAVTHPELFSFARHDVAVELGGAHTRGMTVIDRRLPGRVDVAQTVDAPGALALVLDAVGAVSVS